MSIVSLKWDYSFKELMSNEEVRRYFISDVLGIPVEQIKSVRLSNPFLWKRFKKEKQGILDVKVEMNDNTKINIELQIKYCKHWDRRSIFYLGKMVTEDLRRGEDYDRMKRSICINILNFNYSNSEKYHTVYRMRDETGMDYSDLLEIHNIELRKKLTGTKLDDWIRLFNAKREEDLDMIKTKNPGIREAIKELKVMSLGKRMRMIYEEYLQEERDRRWIEKCEREEKEEREAAFEAKLEAMRQAKEREIEEEWEAMRQAKEREIEEEWEKAQVEIRKEMQEAREKVQIEIQEAREKVQIEMQEAREKMQIETQEVQEHGIRAMILDNLEEEIPEDRICEKLCRRFELSREQAEGYIARYTVKEIKEGAGRSEL